MPTVEVKIVRDYLLFSANDYRLLVINDKVAEIINDHVTSHRILRSNRDRNNY